MSVLVFIGKVLFVVLPIAALLWLFVPTDRQWRERQTPEGKRRAEEAYSRGFTIGLLRGFWHRK